MSSNTQVLIVNNIKLPLNASSNEAFLIAKKRLRQIGINVGDNDLSIYKRSVDARNKGDIKLVYSICAKGTYKNITDAMLSKISGSLLTEGDPLDFERGTEELSAPPLVVGSGPCGLFAALLLAENGYAPIIIERGGSVEERKSKVKAFNELKILDTETNIQFGAGGAGTFSDGKLVTRVNDPISAYVLQRLVEFGAPNEILYLAKPHIGTDILSGIVENILARISALGGTVLYHTKYLSCTHQNGETIAHTSRGEIKCGAILLALGHSARDTYQNMFNSGFLIEPKAFSVGLRIEHKTAMIDKSMYGNFAGHSALGHAEYNLSYNTKERGVYTFCMCPGGEVVAAASEEHGVVVNGMSRHARSGDNSNSAVVCSIFKQDYGSTPQKAIEFQRAIERAAFIAGGSDYSGPIITVGDFLNGECKREPYEVFPTYMNGKNIRLASPESYLPKTVSNSIKNALRDFDRKIHGFADGSAILTGAETRTSAPIRIIRDQKTRLAVGFDNIYPAGEGAGYAGGITSAAIDGVKTAIAIMKRFN
ncbi:MAG: hypothetical protein IJ515_07210 [Clostridia bacterium]|nr:hypothetical protein [Clostridia bacterium]